MVWDCKIKETKDGFVAYLRGELDHHIARELCCALDELIYAHRVKEVVFDLSELHFMDSAGIGLILGRHTKIAQLGGTLTLQNPNPQMEKLLNLAGIGGRVAIVFTPKAKQKGTVNV